jgi:hypothetical protein
VIGKKNELKSTFFLWLIKHVAAKRYGQAEV